jgi:hypothetical protein
MAAPAKNEFWKLVKNPGREMIYKPNELWKKAVEYFTWAEKNPLYEMKVFGTGMKINVPKMRAMTEMAFCLFAGISDDTFRNYKSNEDPYKDFFGVANKISQIIYCQKFEGAAAEFLNPNIIARDLGLSEKQDHTIHTTEVDFT